MSHIEEIFRLKDWQGPITEDDLFYIQNMYFSENQGVPSVTHLISSYKKAPDAVIGALLIVVDVPATCGLSYFPYRSCLELLHTHYSCIEALCVARKSLFLNLLYRVTSAAPTAGLSRTLDSLEILLGFSSAPETLSDPLVWGLFRDRVGVSLMSDNLFHRAIATSDLDITNDSAILSYFTSNFNDLVSEEFTAYMPFFKNNNLQEIIRSFVPEDCVCPCFLDPIFDAHSKADAPVPSLTSLSLFYDSLSNILSRVLSNKAVKDNFMNLIKNVCGQDRKKLAFDKTKSCSDQYAYGVYSILFRLSEGAFRDDFVPKIGINVFPTFSFFYLARLIEITILKDATSMMAGEETTRLSRVLHDAKRLQKYFDFVYVVIEHNEREVYSEIIKEITKSEERDGIGALNSQIDCVDVALSEFLAESVKDLLHDNEFFNTILTIQLFLPKHVTPSLINLISRMLIFRNPHHVTCLRLLCLLYPDDQLTIKRVIGLCTERRDEEKIVNRVLANQFLRYKEIPADQNTLRMVNGMVADMEEWLSRALGAILKIKTYKERGVTLLKTLQENTRENLSDDEELPAPPPESWRRFASMSADQLTEYLRGQDRDQTEEEIRSGVEVVRDAVVYFSDPWKYKLQSKIRVNKNRLEMQETLLKKALQLVENVVTILINWTDRNRRLFLNRNIFQRLCRVIDRLLRDLLGRESTAFRIENKSDYRFNPRELLRSVLIITSFLLGGAPALIKKSGLDVRMLRAGVSVAKEKYLLSLSHLQTLCEIIETLEQSAVQEEEVSLDPETIPDKFLDPLTFVVMENPVKLLTSKVTIDRSTFNQIMLNDRIDPFSRLPLDETKCVEDVELRRELEEYASRAKKQNL